MAECYFPRSAEPRLELRPPALSLKRPTLRCEKEQRRSDEVEDVVWVGSVPSWVELEYLRQPDVVAGRVPERRVDAVGLDRGRVVEGDAARR
jgi:hypothetical protein